MAKKAASIHKPSGAGTPAGTDNPAKNGQSASWGAAAWLLLAALVAYLVLFFRQELPSLGPATAAGDPYTRIWFILQVLLLPEQVVDAWLGTPHQWSLLDRVPIFLTAAALWSVAMVAGWVLLRLLKVDAALTRLEQVVFAAGSGLSLLSLATLLIGLAGGLQWRFVWMAVALVGVALGWLLFCRARRATKESKRDEPSGVAAASSGPHSGPYGWLLVPFVCVIFAGSVLPPIDFDVREYHLQAPKEFYQNGRITFLPHNVYANMPLGSEMFSLLAMHLLNSWWRGALVGKVMIAGFAPLTALGLFACGRRFGTAWAGGAAAVVYLSVPWVVQVSTLGLIDAVVACYLLLAVYTLLLWRENVVSPCAHVNALLVLSGWLAGSAVSIKYPAAVFVVLPLGTWSMLIAWRRNVTPLVESVSKQIAERPVTPGDNQRTRLLRTLVIGGIFFASALMACGPWLMKNALFTGNPVYPLAYRWLDGSTRTPEKDAQWRRAHQPADFSANSLTASATRVLGKSEWLSPLLIPLALAAWLDRGRRPLVRRLTGYCLVVLGVWWLFTHRIDRFWIPIMPVLAWLAGIGVQVVWNFVPSNRPWRIVLATGGAVCLGSCLLMVVAGAGGYNAYLVPLARLRTEPTRVDAWHLELNRIVPPGGRVLAVGDAEVFDLEMPVIYSTPFDDCALEQMVKDQSIEQIQAAFIAARISHVFVHWGEIDRYRSAGNYGFTSFVRPEVFAALIQQGVLGPPLPPVNDAHGNPHPGEVFPVICAAGSWPSSPD